MLPSWLNWFRPVVNALRGPVNGRTALRWKAPDKRVLPLTLEERLQRALTWADREAKLANEPERTLYRLDAGKNGGRNPFADHPGSLWKDEEGNTHRSLDCVGAVCYWDGIDRYQPETFPIYGGWMNTDAILLDARGWHGVKPKDWERRVELAPRSWWEVVHRPYPGCNLVYGSVNRGGAGGRIGHIAKVVSLDSSIPMTSRDYWEAMMIVHCSAGNSATLGHAIAKTNALAFYGRDRQGRAKDTAFIDLVSY